MSITTDHETLRRWATMHGHSPEQAEAIVADPQEYRRVLTNWFADRNLDPNQAQDPATPPDPVLLAEWGPTRGVQPATAGVWASTREDFPAARLVGEYAADVRNRFQPGLQPQGPKVYSLAELEVWDGPQRAARIDPEQFAPDQRMTVVEFAQRTGKDRSTLSKAVNNPAYQGPEATVRAPERGEDRKFNARELAAFVNALPGRRGRLPKNRG